MTIVEISKHYSPHVNALYSQYGSVLVFHCTTVYASLCLKFQTIIWVLLRVFSPNMEAFLQRNNQYQSILMVFGQYISSSRIGNCHYS